MGVPAGIKFMLSELCETVPGCTISEALFPGNELVTAFSLASGTDISAESYPYAKLVTVHRGNPAFFIGEHSVHLSAGECVVTPFGSMSGTEALVDTVYSEIMLKEETDMNQSIEFGKVFSLGNLVPYRDGKIVNMDIAKNDKMKFVVMAFDAGTGLSEHAAPCEAMIFALEGEGTIVYEGKEHQLRAGEQFVFANGGLHAVRAEQRFKMAILLVK